VAESPGDGDVVAVVASAADGYGDADVAAMAVVVADGVGAGDAGVEEAVGADGGGMGSMPGGGEVAVAAAAVEGGGAGVGDGDVVAQEAPAADGVDRIGGGDDDFGKVVLEARSPFDAGVLKCMDGHTLKRRMADEEYECDICSSDILVGERLLYCKRCDVSVCLRCRAEF
jgi:hypothetical protein